MALQASGWPALTTYSWSGPSILGVTNSSIAIVGSNGVYTCSLSTPGSCQTVLKTIVTSSASLMNVNVTPSVTSICSGGNTILAASGGITYLWAPIGTLSSSTGTFVTANPNSTTVYLSLIHI